MMLLLLTAVVLVRCLSDWLGYSYKLTIRGLQSEKRPKHPLMLKRGQKRKRPKLRVDIRDATRRTIRAMEIAWCWRCNKEVPMIDEVEWQALWTYTADQPIMQECQRLTGLPSNVTTRKLMLSHRRSMYGPPCPNCGKL